MARPVAVEARDLFRIWLRYDDGTEGEVDLSDLAGRGVLAAWRDPTVFRAVTLGSHGAIEWPGQLDMCGDALYLRLTGKAAQALELPAPPHVDA